MQEYRRKGLNCDFGGWATKNTKGMVSSFGTAISVGGILRIRKERSELRFRNGLFFRNCDFGGWDTKNTKGTISSFGMVIRYRGKWEAGVCRLRLLV
ncbi:unnamed protein product [Rhizophagus irregularis]|nr:unnamed protein product [Rhizophagus irregularis]